ncbi:MAG: hypothetical protein AAF567_09450 [Actinomycetota bacterium]
MRRVLILLFSLLLVAGCGAQTAADGAVSLIEGDFASQNGIDLSNAVCDSPATEAVGTTFSCTAVHAGRSVNFDVLIDREDHITVSSTNVVYPPALEAIEATIVDSVNERGELGLPPGSVDCGDVPVVLDVNRIFVCGLTEPDTANVFDTFVRVQDMDNLIFDFEFAPEPRP